MDRTAVLRRVLLPVKAYLPDLVLIGGWVPWLYLQGRGRETSQTLEADLLVPSSLPQKGRSLALASFSAPLKRSTAERKIRELLERIRLVNRDPYYLYAVVRVLLFGSMLGESNRVGDVDLVIDLESKVEDREGREAEERARAQAALDSGRRFSNILEALSWPRDEVFLYLKSSSRGLSFHTSDDEVLKGITTKRLFP